MPLYEYQCDTCGHRFERIQKFSDPPVDVCPVDGGPVRKLLSSPAIQFKGSGWYITDYAKKPAADKKSDPATKQAASEGSAATDSKTGAGDAPAAAPAKTETKKESAKE
jgi:putative FmdB family regulatory protein